MTIAENKEWDQFERTPLDMLYAAKLVVRAFGESQLANIVEPIAYNLVTDPEARNIHSVKVDTDPDLSWLAIDFELEAESDLEAFEAVAESAIKAWLRTGHDPGVLEFVAAHLAYEPELREVQLEEPGAKIDSTTRFDLEDLELPRLDTFNEPKRIEVRQIFYETRDMWASTA
jgi:hypothetical protein